MRFAEFLTGGGFDFSATDGRFRGFLAEHVPWLDEARSYRARLGLHELLVNIREHVYTGGEGSIEVGATATASAVTVTVTDWGTALPVSARPRALPLVSAEGGYGLAIIDQVFDEVSYRRARGRNEWILTLRSAGAEQR